jgi:undecaprenyl-diphosphatase
MRAMGRTGILLTTRILVTLLALGLLGFVLLALLYDHAPLSTLDAHVSRSVAESMPSRAEELARPFSWAGGWIGITVLAVATLVLLVRERSWLDLGFLLVAVVGSQLLVLVLKVWFDRPRPDAGSAIPLPSSASFPSGHATSGVACIGAVAVLATERVRSNRARTWILVTSAVLALAIGLSRIVLNVHFVTDVLAGWCFGLAWLAACLLVRDRLARRRVSRPSALPLRS